MAGRKTHIIFNITAFLVGGIFIFSGAVKINDPMGTAIKLEEYFEVFSADIAPFFHNFVPYALGLSLFLCVFEIALGFAILLKFKIKWTIALLFALLGFFTFLTFYSAYFNKVTDCGCFGDFLKLTPWQSFSKDVFLLVLTSILAVTRRDDMDNPPKIMATFVGAFSLISLLVGLYAVEHLPFKDFRAYKVGTDIPKAMKPEKPCKYVYIMEKDGKEFKMNAYPKKEEGYTYKSMITLNPEECQPKIIDFGLWHDEDGDKTEEVLEGTYCIVVVHNIEKTERAAYEKINALIKEIDTDGTIKPLVFTSANAASFDVFRHDVNLAAPYLLGDATLLKTIIRSNPGIVLMKDGVVKGKWHYNDTPKLEKLQKALK